MTLITYTKNATPKSDPASQYSHFGLKKQPPGIQSTKALSQATLFLPPYTGQIGQVASQVTAVIRLPNSLSLRSRARCACQRPGPGGEPPSPLPYGSPSAGAGGNSVPSQGFRPRNAALTHPGPPQQHGLPASAPSHVSRIHFRGESSLQPWLLLNPPPPPPPGGLPGGLPPRSPPPRLPPQRPPPL